MTTAEMIQALIANHNNAAASICALPDAQFTHSHNGKWNAGQQLSHLTLCLLPISQAIASSQYIQEKFGTIDRTPMSYDALIAFYKKGLENGGKAPERFLPPPVDATQRQTLQQDLSKVLSTIQKHLSAYTEEELDTLVLPHPFLGMLSLRELFFLMSYHPLHHLAQVNKNLEAFAE